MHWYAYIQLQYNNYYIPLEASGYPLQWDERPCQKNAHQQAHNGTNKPG